MSSGLLDRHLAFVEALRGAGLPVSLAEDLDALAALRTVPWSDRGLVREVYAATLVKTVTRRPTFDTLFDLYFPARVGGSAADERIAADGVARDSGAVLEGLREQLAQALEFDDASMLDELAVEAVGRFGAMPGRGPGLAGWSSYTALRRIDPDGLAARIVAALVAVGRTEAEAERAAARRIGAFTRRVEADARRRIAEERGPDHVADVTIRPSVDRLDFLSARRSDLDEMRRLVPPLARRLATRLTKERHSRRRGPLDMRRTVRASVGSGGVPLEIHHRPRRPHRSELVVLCDVSGSVANFAQFTLLLVFALREQFDRIRAFTFVDTVHEVTDVFVPGADPVDVLSGLAASAAHAARFGRTDYGRALRRFAEEHADAVGPRSSLLILGDARSNYGDLALDELRDLAGRARHAWWLNPEHRRHWDTGDSAAGRYGEVVPMVECRNLNQLAEFVHDIC